MNSFDNWNKIKKDINLNNNVIFHIKNREIFNTQIGKNIGFESFGKGEKFIRPVLILKTFGANSFYGIPLSTTKNRGRYYFEFIFKEEITSVALLSQMRFFDKRRLLNKIGVIKKDDFEKIKRKLNMILELPSTCCLTKDK